VPLPLGDDIDVPKALRRRVASFWRDEATSFAELLVLSHWADALFAADPRVPIRRLPEMLVTTAGREIGLCSDRPEERTALERRIERLSQEAGLLRRYQATLIAVWEAVEPSWVARGRDAVLAACAEWLSRLATGAPLLELLSTDHAVLTGGLDSLVNAALARGEVVITPCYFLEHGHLWDLPQLLSIGVQARVRNSNAYASQGQQAARLARVLGTGNRAALLSMVMDGPTTVHHAAHQLNLTTRTVARNAATLLRAGLIVENSSANSIRYQVVPGALDGLLNEVSQRIARHHGRSSRLYADAIGAAASFRAVFEHAPVAMIQLDLEGRCLSCNVATQRLFQYTETEMGQLRGRHLVIDETDQDAFDVRHRPRQYRQHRNVRLRRKDGSMFWAAITLAPVHGRSGAPKFGYVMIEDVSERLEGADLVTGLPNRALFIARLQQLLGEAKRATDNLALLVLDLDKFKQVNDTFGHAAGDDLLRQVGRRLTTALRDDDLVARIGGDEFAIVLDGAVHDTGAAAAVEKIQESLRRPFSLSDGNFAFVGVSIGVALTASHRRDVEDLMERADAAMYRAKRRGTGYELSNELTSASIGA